MTELLDLVVLDSVIPWLLLAATLIAILVVPKLFGMRLLTAIAYAQMTLAFNAVTIIAGIHSEAIGVARALHFYATEFAFLLLTFAAYKRILRDRMRVLDALNAFFAGRGAAWLTLLVALVGVFNLIVVPTDGESRIGYMTAQWFSLLKPLIQIAMPLAYLGVLVLLLNPNRRRLGYALLLITIVSNILTGSKASFLFSLATAFLALRDLSGRGSLPIRAAIFWKPAMLALPLAVLALVRLEVTPSDVVSRFLLFGEATILTYFSDTPTAACNDVSTLASMHRGVARALGDASANDIDTLFGFALTKLQLGENTLTGPNGRLSAYFLCNFPDGKMVLGWLMVAVYFALIAWLFARARRRRLLLALVFPYIVTSLGQASQDFNLIMADITLVTMLLLVTTPLYSRRKRYAIGQVHPVGRDRGEGSAA